MPRPTDSAEIKTEQYRKLFIGGLASTTTNDILRDFYSKWGELTDCVVMKDSRTKRSRGFGFVTFKEPEMVDAAQAARPHEIDGKIVETKRAMPREDSNSEEAHMTVNKLFVGGMKKEVTEDDLREYFAPFGSIKSCDIVMDKNTRQSRGFGFIVFEDYDSVDKAILQKPHTIKGSKCDVKKALNKDQMNSIRKKRDYSVPEPSYGYGAAPGYYDYNYREPAAPYPPYDYGYGYGAPPDPYYGGGGYGQEFGQYRDQQPGGGPMRGPGGGPVGGGYRGAPYASPPKR